MSDGISEGYRASRAAESFEDMWRSAQADIILLDLEAETKKMSFEDLMKTLIELCPSVKIKNFDQFEVAYSWGINYQDSYDSRFTPEPPMVRLYRLETSSEIHKTFQGKDLTQLMVKAVLFNEWLKTDEGQRAVKVYNDY